MKFSDRLNIARDFENWVVANGVASTCFGLITYLDSIGLLRDEQEVIPVDFIEDEIDRIRLEIQIAMSEGDFENSDRWIIRKKALETMIEKWRAEREEE